MFKILSILNILIKNYPNKDELEKIENKKITYY